MAGRHRIPVRHRRPAVTGLVTAALVAGCLAAVTTTAQPAAALSARSSVVRTASDYGADRGYRVGIAVLDTKTGQLIGNKYRRSTFASESVIKVLIAARLVLQGRMHGATAKRARTMIACSHDGIASSFYGSVGGDSLVSWAKKRFHVSMLGSGPIRSNWWGSFRITAEGLVRLYAKLKANRAIGPWLLRAMHAHTKRGCDGFDQSFGLPRASRNVAVKQGWGSDYSYRTSNASQNSTGFVNGDRYAVAILARGKGSTYGTKIGKVITAVAKRLLPGGTFPSGKPVVSSLSVGSGPAAGGTTLTIRGRELGGATSVTFGGTRARVRSSSSTTLVVTTPRHASGRVQVVVTTRFGRSSGTVRFTFVAPRPKPTPPPTTPPATTSAPTKPPPTTPAPTNPPPTKLAPSSTSAG